MIFPALMALPSDPVLAVHPAAQRVYFKLLGELTFSEPRNVKLWLKAEELKLKKETVRDALNLLVKRGYLFEHDRDSSGVRRFTLVWSLAA